MYIANGRKRERKRKRGEGTNWAASNQSHKTHTLLELKNQFRNVREKASVCVETEECVCGEAGPSFLELDGKHHGGFTEFGTAGKLCGMDTGTACTEPAFGRSSQTRKKKKTLS